MPAKYKKYNACYWTAQQELKVIWDGDKSRVNTMRSEATVGFPWEF